jgi:NTP pyrophosphatase (non-canonical NTP hydrolase)
MNDEQYTQHVMARASTQWHGEKVDFDDLKEVLKDFIEHGQRLDRIKKSLMYGREFEWEEDVVQVVETETPPIPEHEQGIAHAILGCATEGVELVEALNDYLFNNKEFDLVNLQEEFGDVQWYRALGLQHVNQTHVENITQNDAKLEKRFGPVDVGFSYKAVNERDLESERKVLERYISDADLNDVKFRTDGENGDVV